MIGADSYARRAFLNVYDLLLLWCALIDCLLSAFKCDRMAAKALDAVSRYGYRQTGIRSMSEAAIGDDSLCRSKRWGMWSINRIRLGTALCRQQWYGLSYVMAK